MTNTETTNTHSSALLRIMGISLLVLGTFLLLLGTNQKMRLQGDMSGQGTTVFMPPVTEETLEQGIVYSSALEEPKSPSSLLFMTGILFFLLGFGIHALLVIRERPVPVTSVEKVLSSVKPKKKKRIYRLLWMKIRR